MCRKILATEPRQADALHLLGVIAGQTGRHTDAVAAFRQALTFRPDHPETYRNLSVALRAAGKVDEAITACHQAIAIKPDYAEAHKTLGGLLHGNGQLDQAIAAYRHAIIFRPDYAEAHCNLGAALKDAAQHDEAIAVCQQAIALNARLPEAHNNLGNALYAKGEPGKSIAAYRSALALAPGFASAWNNLGMALKLHAQPAEAIAAFQKAVELKPDYANAFANLGHALKEDGRIAEAIIAYQKAVALRPDSPDLRHVLAALTGEHSPSTTPASYVRNLFDPYAGEFDEHLVTQLHYRAPEQLLEAILTLAPGRQFDILDLGCGTGLCGVQFRSIARHLLGVDLSPAMIAKAASRNIYNRLITADITEAMRDQRDCIDLIIAADLFVYVGDLADVFHLAARTLRAGGLFAFSLERHEGEGFVLTAKVRFAHSLTYVRELSRIHGFSELHVREIALRRSSVGDVAGWLVVLQSAPARDGTG